VAQWLTNPTRNHEVAGSIPGSLASLSGLRLWRRLAATAPIRPPAWEPPYAAGAAQEETKKKKKKKKKLGEGLVTNLLTYLRRNQPCWQLNLKLSAARTVRQYISPV